MDTSNQTPITQSQAPTSYSFPVVYDPAYNTPSIPILTDGYSTSSPNSISDGTATPSPPSTTTVLPGPSTNQNQQLPPVLPPASGPQRNRARTAQVSTQIYVDKICDHCNGIFSHRKDHPSDFTRDHVNRCIKVRFPCDVEGCTSTFSRKDTLKKHKKKKHGIK